MLKQLAKGLGHPLFVSLLRIALGVVFIAASLDKIQNPQSFADNIANYRVMPYQLVNLVAVTLPWVEIVTGSLLVTGIWIRTNALIVSGMLVVFSLAILQALLRNLDISCGCFSTDPAAYKMTRLTLYWNLIWLCWGILVTLCDQGRYTVGKVSARAWRKEKGTGYWKERYKPK
jgi:putative oxidoreductase